MCFCAGEIPFLNAQQTLPFISDTMDYFLARDDLHKPISLTTRLDIFCLAGSAQQACKERCKKGLFT